MPDYINQNTPAGSPDKKTLQQIYEFVQQSGMIPNANTAHQDKFLQQNQQGRQNVEGAYQNFQNAQKPSKVEKYAGYASAGAFLLDSIFGDDQVKEDLGKQVDETAQVFTDYRKGKDTKNRQAFMDSLNKEQTFDRYNVNDYNISSDKENAKNKVNSDRLNTANSIYGQEQINKRSKDQQAFSEKQRKILNPIQQLDYDNKIAANKVLDSGRSVDEWTVQERRSVEKAYPNMEIKDSYETFKDLQQTAKDSAKETIKRLTSDFQKSDEYLGMTIEERENRIKGFETWAVDQVMESYKDDPKYAAIIAKYMGGGSSIGSYGSEIGPGIMDGINLKDLVSSNKNSKSSQIESNLSQEEVIKQFVAENKKKGRKNPENLSPVQIIELIASGFNSKDDFNHQPTGVPTSLPQALGNLTTGIYGSQNARR